jgi:valyl-tRNA synthetase
MEEIRDWCISRQIWWGHRIPAWYDPEGRVYVARNEAEARAKYELSPDLPLQQDEDVLDTWFSSALWPFATLGWPDQTAELKTFYPTTVMVTAFDILFFWVARMAMMGLKLTGEVPFRTVYIHGLVRDAHGQKMSKSKGNVLDPLDIIDGRDVDSLVAKMTQGLMQPEMAAGIAKNVRREFPHGFEAYGTDALRFTFAVLAGSGRDIAFDIRRLAGSRAFCTKVWNAARFVLMNADSNAAPAAAVPDEMGDRRNTIDRWIRSRFAHALKEVRRGIADYRFDQVAQAIYDFTWSHYCDWYLELSKIVLADDERSAEERAATRRTLIEILEGLLRLMHPVMPFISEELWQAVAPLAGIRGKSIMLCPFPEESQYHPDDDAEEEIGWLQRMVVEIRRIRAEMDVPYRKQVALFLSGGDDQVRDWVARHRAFVISLGKLSSIEWLPPGASEPESAVAVVGELRLLIPMEDLIDREAELRRLSREIDALNDQLAKSKAKLDNPNFAARAPAAVVEQERRRLADAERDLIKLQDQKSRLERA